MIGSPLMLGDLPSSPPKVIAPDTSPSLPEAEAPAQSDHSFDDRFSEDPPSHRWSFGGQAPADKGRGCGFGLGCLAVIAALCCAGGWLFQSASIPFLMNEGGELDAHASLTPMIQALGKIEDACKKDDLTKGELIHPSAAESLAGEVCAMNSQAMIRSVAKTPAAEVLSDTPDRTYVVNTNLSADQCYRFLSDDYKIIGCWENDQYRLLHVESFR